MQQRPPITISSLDSSRLETILDKLDHNRFPDSEALEAELNRANVVEPRDMPPDVVTMNSTVRFIDDKNKSEFQLTLVYPDGIAAKLAGEPTKLASEAEAEPVQKVSVLAPVGSALLGLSVGQSIEWQIPGGRQLNLRILSVVRQPEAQGDFSS